MEERAGSGAEAGGSAPSALDFLALSFALHRRLASLVQDASKEFALNPSEALALLCLSRRAEPVSEVARQVGLRPNGASVLISRLSRRHLVRRQRSRRDRRVSVISLTDAGLALAASVELKLWREAERFLSPLQPSLRGSLFSSMLRLAGDDVRTS